jgi:hypothetical protein
MADLSDDLNTIPKFLEKLEKGYDLVCGSRYMRGGSSGDLSFFKVTVSSGFSTLSRLFIGIKVHDITNAFRAFKKGILKSLVLKSDDYAISPEFTLKAYLTGFKISEVPTTYTSRRKGITKFKMLEIGIKYFRVFLWAFILKLRRSWL